MMDKILDFMDNYIFNPIVFFLGCFVALVLLAMSYTSSKEEFMKDCLADGKKKYECTAMWGASQNQNTYVYVR